MAVSLQNLLWSNSIVKMERRSGHFCNLHLAAMGTGQSQSLQCFQIFREHFDGFFPFLNQVTNKQFLFIYNFTAQYTYKIADWLNAIYKVQREEYVGV